LRLASGELCDGPFEKIADLENLKHVVHRQSCRVRGGLPPVGSKENVFAHREVWEQGSFLRNVAHSACSRGAIDSPLGRKERLAVNLYLSGRDFSQSRDGIKQRGLAGAGRTEDGGHTRVKRCINVKLKTRQRYAAP
jgi:hypothetical protein